ncbi:MAG: HAD family phosphatase [Simkaniaceae bacterium]
MEPLFQITENHLFLFDFDGLIVDTERIHFAAYQQMVQDRGYLLSWDFSAYCKAAHIGDSGIEDQMVSDIPALKETPWEVLRKEKQEIYQSLIEKGHIHFMPGALDLLKLLAEKKIRHGIVTNSSRKQIEEIQRHLPFLQKVPFWITRDDAPRPKPYPDPYLLAVEKHGKKEDAIVGFEDTCKGAEALKAANIPAILICDDDHPQLSCYDTAFLAARFPSLKDFLHHCK